MPPFSVTALLGGRLVGTGLACGLNLYATIALTGLVARLGWIELPPGLIGLEQGLLIAGATALFLAESIAATIPIVEALWEAVHTVIRPLAAGSLVVVALEGAPWPMRLVGGLVAAIAAFASHTAKVGLRLIVTQKRARRIAINAAEDLAAAILALAALIHPVLALATVAAFVGMLVKVGPGLWRAAAFAGRAMVSVLRGFFGAHGWTAGDDLPRACRRRLTVPEVGQAPARAARATLTTRTTGSWRSGWLVVDGRSATFLFRQALRLRSTRLPRPAEPTIQHRLLADVVTWTADNDAFSLHLHKDGPPAEITVGALQLVIQ